MPSPEITSRDSFNISMEPILNEDIIPHRDVEKIITGIKSPKSEKSLFEDLKISLLGKQLQKVREDPESSPEKKTLEEKRIADIIQDGVSKIPYSGEPSPDKILETNSSNCAARSLIGGAYFKQAGLNYLVGTTINHSIILQVFSYGEEVVFRDMQEDSSAAVRITDNMIKGQRSDGNPLNVHDIVRFSKEPEPDTKGLRFNLNIDPNKFPNGNDIGIFAPKVGHSIQILNNLVIFHANQGDTDKAIKTTLEIIDINSQDAEAYLNLGIWKTRQGDYKEAAEAYERATKINPKNADAYFHLGISHAKQDDYKEAIKAFTSVLDINPQDAEACVHLGISHARQGDYKEAAEAYENALRINPQETNAYFNLGNCYARQGDNKKGIKAYEKFIEREKNHVDAYVNLGVCYAREGNHKKAAEAYKNALRINPQDAAALNNLNIAEAELLKQQSSGSGP